MGSGLVLDPFPPNAGGTTANDAALLLVDRRNTVSTFRSNGSRTGILGDIPADLVVGGKGAAIVNQLSLDSFSNLRYVARSLGVEIFRSGDTTGQPTGTLLPSDICTGVALDRTR